MNDALPDSWAAQERRWRIFCYWSWLSPLAWSTALIPQLIPLFGQGQWILDLALGPLWIIALVHLAYFRIVSRKDRPATVWPALAVSAVAAGWSFHAAGLAAAISCGVCAPLLVFYGAAYAPVPTAGSRRAGGAVLSVAMALLPVWTLILITSITVLFCTHHANGFLKSHQILWSLAAGLSGIMLASLVFLYAQICRNARSAFEPPLQRKLDLETGQR
jgi:hypothetical protein